MVGDDDDLVAVPDLGVLAEVLLEDADGARAADVVRHEDVDVDPDVVAGPNAVAAGMAGQDFFGQGHGGMATNLKCCWSLLVDCSGQGHFRRPLRSRGAAACGFAFAEFSSERKAASGHYPKRGPLL